MPPLTLSDWQSLYRSGEITPQTAIRSLLQKIVADDPAWILLLDADSEALSKQLVKLEQCLAAVDGDISRLPLYGVPFAVKDNIDVAALSTTAACPAFAYTATMTAPSVQRLLDAGAILIGKTNLDQFATGLVGTRSPYGVVPNSFDANYIGGGSSSGSASVVARGLVPFALGTDTAGSGRVPAGLNNIVGLKPTRGWLSSRGMVPACRSLDCLSILALTVDDANFIARLAAAYDEHDPYSRVQAAATTRTKLPERPRLGVPASPQFFGDQKSAAAFAVSLKRIESLGAELVPLDFAPLHGVAALLYEGAWLAERYAAIEDFMCDHAAEMNPVVRGIIEPARTMSAADAFKSEYRRAQLAREAQRLMHDVDALLVPTAPIFPTIAAVEAEPVTLNRQLGTYTNFVNLLNYCALALPAGLRSDGLPFGITLIAPAWSDAALAEFGQRWQRHAPWTLGTSGRPIPQAGVASKAIDASTNDVVRLAVVGAHLSGMPLNHQLTERNARLIETSVTASNYRLLALPGTVPPKPGLVKAQTGASIEVELWDMPVAAFGSFVALISAPLGIGTLDLADGRKVKGFICEGWAAESARDITEFGGWRAFLAASKRADCKSTE